MKILLSAVFCLALSASAFGQCGSFALNPVTKKLDCIGTGNSISGITVTGAPSAGQEIVATSSTTATWQTTSAANGTCALAAATTCSITLTGVAALAVWSCYDNSGVNPLIPNTFTITADTLTFNFSAPATGYCNASTGVGLTGATGPAGSSAFSALTSGTNSGMTAHVGTGASLDASGSGAITATTITGALIPQNIAKQDVMDAVAFCADAGSTDAYACNLSPAITAYVTGTHYRFKANTVNTGAATIAFNSLSSPKTIVKVAGGITTALADNDIRAGQWVDVVYDGTNMQMQSTLGNAAGGGSPGGADLTLQYNIDGSTFGGIPLLLWDKAYVSFTLFTDGGSALNDCIYGGTATTGGVRFVSIIDSAGTPDTIQWSSDGGSTFTPGLALTGVAQNLTAGVTITCAATTGHAVGDTWTAVTGLLTEPSTNITYGQSQGIFKLPRYTSGILLSSAIFGSTFEVVLMDPNDPDDKLVLGSVAGNSGNVASFIGTSEITSGRVAVLDSNLNVGRGPTDAPGVFTNDGSGGLSWKAGLAGQAACWKTNGDLSYCESVVGVAGACTCH